MSVILARGIIKRGQVIVPKPIDLPDGTEVVVTSGSPLAEGDSDEDWDNSPEGISAWLKWYDSLEPLIFSDEERAAWEADRQARKEWENAEFDRHADKLRSIWE